jgi:hypothetical protein
LPLVAFFDLPAFAGAASRLLSVRKKVHESKKKRFH